MKSDLCKNSQFAVCGMCIGFIEMCTFDRHVFVGLFVRIFHFAFVGWLFRYLGLCCLGFLETEAVSPDSTGLLS